MSDSFCDFHCEYISRAISGHSYNHYRFFNSAYSPVRKVIFKIILDIFGNDTFISIFAESLNTRS